MNAETMPYLPLHKGRNELVLAVSEIGGGWGFVGRLAKQARTGNAKAARS